MNIKDLKNIKKTIDSLDGLPKDLKKELNKNFFKKNIGERIINLVKEWQKEKGYVTSDELLIKYYQKYKEVLKRGTLHSHLSRLINKKILLRKTENYAVGRYSLNKRSDYFK